jgi:hypothetical protein
MDSVGRRSGVQIGVNHAMLHLKSKIALTGGYEAEAVGGNLAHLIFGDFG